MATSALANHVVEDIQNPLGWMLRRNKRMYDQLVEIPGAESAIAKVCRGMDVYCRRHGLDTVQQRSRVMVDASYIDSTDSIVVRLSH